MSDLEIRTSAADGRVVVALIGECDLAVQDELTSALQAALGQSHEVVVDLRELSFMDSSGINGLVMAHHAARERGAHLYVVNATGVVANVLNLTGLGLLLAPPAPRADGSPTGNV